MRAAVRKILDRPAAIGSTPKHNNTRVFEDYVAPRMNDIFPNVPDCKRMKCAVTCSQCGEVQDAGHAPMHKHGFFCDAHCPVCQGAA